MVTELTSLVRRFVEARVVLVGDLILDRYMYGDAERISPEAPVPVLRAVERHERAGGSANVAACLRTLGASVQCFGAVGDDAEGRRVRSLLADMGARHDGCVVADDRGTTTKTRFVGLAQHRHRQQLLRFDDETTTPLPPRVAEQLVQGVVAAIRDADVVCIEDYRKGVISAELVAAVVQEAARHDKPVIVDPARISDFSDYTGATLLTPNRSELELATGMTFESAASVVSVCAELLQKWNVRSLVVTLDREGAVLAVVGESPIHIPTRPRSIYDNTGAGDAVLATLAASVAVKATPVDSVRLANIAGGLEVEKFGCVPITADEILADLRIEHRRRNGKLRNLDDLVSELSLRRDRGETVVFTNGVFDIMHPGHVAYLARARDAGSLLVVGLNSDRSVKQLDKGDERPINDQAFRATMLGALECVDYVVIFEESDPLSLIERVRPNVLIKGEDWATRGVVGREFVESIGGRVSLVPLLEGYSTTSIVERIRNGRR